MKDSKKKLEVLDKFRSYDGQVLYGYCHCGREVHFSNAEYFDKTCPLCGAELDWGLAMPTK